MYSTLSFLIYNIFWFIIYFNCFSYSIAFKSKLEIIEELKKIALFSYPHLDYSFGLNDEISVIPSFDLNQCEFSISLHYL